MRPPPPWLLLGPAPPSAVIEKSEVNAKPRHSSRMPPTRATALAGIAVGAVGTDDGQGVNATDRGVDPDPSPARAALSATVARAAAADVIGECGRAVGRIGRRALAQTAVRSSGTRGASGNQGDTVGGNGLAGVTEGVRRVTAAHRSLAADVDATVQREGFGGEAQARIVLGTVTVPLTVRKSMNTCGYAFPSISTIPFTVSPFVLGCRVRNGVIPALGPTLTKSSGIPMKPLASVPDPAFPEPCAATRSTMVGW